MHLVTFHHCSCMRTLPSVKLKSLSLKDNPCQRSAHQQKHDPRHKDWSLAALRGEQHSHGAQGQGDGSAPPARCCAPESHTDRLACVMFCDCNLTSPLREEGRNNALVSRLCCRCGSRLRAVPCAGHLRSPHWINWNEAAHYATANLVTRKTTKTHLVR